MTNLQIKYGFPLFTNPTTTVYLGYDKKLIISDVWAFWDYVIKKKNRNTKFLLSLLEQAKNFYTSADIAPIKSKPLLYYYSFLNLAKIVLNFNYNYGETADYIHGLSERNNTTFHTSDITLQPISRPGRVKVASELYELFNQVTTTANTTINLKDVLLHCVGIHRAYSEIYKIDEVFCKLSNPNYYRNGRTIGMKANIQCNKNESTDLLARGYNIVHEDNEYYLIEEYTTTRYQPARDDYYSLSKQIRDKGIWYFLGGKDYTMYLSKSANHRYPTEMTIYWTIYYLGSITRYRPNLFDDIFNDMERWLLSEFLTTQPKQLLYLMTSKMVGSNVLKAYSSI